MGRKTAVREVQVEEVVNKREEKTGGQAGEVHLGVLYFERHIYKWSYLTEGQRPKRGRGCKSRQECLPLVIGEGGEVQR